MSNVTGANHTICSRFSSIQEPDSGIEISRVHQPDQVWYEQPSRLSVNAAKCPCGDDHECQQQNQPPERRSVQSSAKKQQRPHEIYCKLRVIQRERVASLRRTGLPHAQARPAHEHVQYRPRNGNIHAGGASGGCTSAAYCDMLPIVSQAASPPTARGSVKLKIFILRPSRSYLYGARGILFIYSSLFR